MSTTASLHTLGMVAGEASGDLLASLVLAGVNRRWPGVHCTGIGGPRMAQQGFDAWWPHERLAVRGYIEVLRHYRGIVGIRNKLKARWLAQPPQLFVGVDAPDFNLSLAQALREAGVPTLQMVCPSIWAWRPDRVETLRRSVDHVLCLFPFEPALLHQHGIGATYIGHPLAQAIALHAMALQVADAHAEVAELASAFGGRIAETPHPHQGFRERPDEMIEIVEIYQQRGEGESPFSIDEIASLVHLEPRPWILAANDLSRLDADLEFAEDAPARLEVDAGARHASLGSGLQTRLILPVEPDEAIAQKLNAAECLEPDAHQLGAWCIDEERGLMFTGFAPAAAYMPGLSRALVYHLSARNEWARALLFPAG